MEVVLPSIQLLWITPRAEQEIEEAGRTCYQSEGKITEKSAAPFIQKLIGSGHESVLEHGVASFRIICDRGVSHEQVRHRLTSISQQSTRFCDFSKLDPDHIMSTPDIKVIRPLGIAEDPGISDPNRKLGEKFWQDACLQAERSYLGMRKLGYSPQTARACLTISLQTEMVITANFREWRLIITQRTSPKAHPHIRLLITAISQALYFECPNVFAGLGIKTGLEHERYPGQAAVALFTPQDRLNATKPCRIPPNVHPGKIADDQGRCDFCKDQPGGCVNCIKNFKLERCAGSDERGCRMAEAVEVPYKASPRDIADKASQEIERRTILTEDPKQCVLAADGEDQELLQAMHEEQGGCANCRPTDAVEILKKRYVGDDPERLKALEAERKQVNENIDDHRATCEDPNCLDCTVLEGAEVKPPKQCTACQAAGHDDQCEDCMPTTVCEKCGAKSYGNPCLACSTQDVPAANLGKVQVVSSDGCECDAVPESVICKGCGVEINPLHGHACDSELSAKHQAECDDTGCSCDEEKKPHGCKSCAECIAEGCDDLCSMCAHHAKHVDGICPGDRSKCKICGDRDGGCANCVEDWKP